jgi:hypothetical protein
MAKRYYNLERETKDYLKSCDNLSIVPFTTNYKLINDFCIKQKTVGYQCDIADPRFFRSRLALWFDIEDFSTLYNSASGNILASVGQTVQQWSDKSGNNRNLVQNTDISKPILNSGFLTFDGSNDEMLVTIPASTSWTLFVVMKENTFVATRRYWGIGAGLCGGSFTSGLYSYYSILRNGFSAWANEFGNTSVFSTTLFNYINTTQLKRKYNRDPYFSEDPANSGSTDTIFGIGSRSNSSLYSAISVKEIILFQQSLDDVNSDKIQRYLGAKYNLF